MRTRVAINGFGRIGRSVLRAWALAHRGRWPKVEIRAINDVAPLETCAYLFEFDSVFGPYPGTVEVAENALIVDGRTIPFTRIAAPGDMNLTGVDILMECTGRARDRAVAEAGLTAGAARVLISGPSPKADLTLVLGANDAAILPRHRIISNASCTTNAIAPLMRLLDDAYGLETALVTTVHCYTGSQPTVDAPAGDNLARSRAAALSMVPTSTSAEHLVDLVLPHLAGRITGSAVRVPTASVSAVDMAVITREAPQAEEVRARFSAASGPIIGYTDRPLVSADLRARSESVIIAGPEIKRARGGMLRVFGWYDNEWGFSCRMLDVAHRMGVQE
ncbi:MAG: aldehyde dehydrogenase [Rhodobacteraceae bacterium]|nr:aldehyde dehydrogenase [Paracoccaceae bacterium]